MSFSPFTSPASSPSTKGKFFSRLSPNSPLSPVSNSSSAASSPTAATSPLLFGPSSSLLVSPTQGTTRLISQATVGHKQALSRPRSHSDEMENSSPGQPQDSESQSDCTCTTSSVNSRSPTSRLPPTSAMATIFEEDGGSSGSKTSIVNDSDCDGIDSATKNARRNVVRGERSTNALSSGGGNVTRIIENSTSFTELKGFNSRPNVEGGAKLNPLQSSTHDSQSRTTALPTDSGERDGSASDPIQERKLKDVTFNEILSVRCRSNTSPLCKRDSATTQNSSSSSSLLYTRSRSLPGPQSSASLQSRGAEMTKSFHQPLTRTASVSSLDHMSDGELSDNEIDQLSRSAPASKFRQMLQENHSPSLDRATALQRKKSVTEGGGLNSKRQRSGLPSHIKRTLTDHIQVASSRPQSPLVLHQLSSPQRAPPSRSMSNPKSIDTLADVAPKGKRPVYTHSLSEPATESDDRDHKTVSQLKKSSSSSPRRSGLLLEKDGPFKNKLVLLIRVCKSVLLVN